MYADGGAPSAAASDADAAAGDGVTADERVPSAPCAASRRGGLKVQRREDVKPAARRELRHKSPKRVVGALVEARRIVATGGSSAVALAWSRRMACLAAGMRPSESADEKTSPMRAADW